MRKTRKDNPHTASLSLRALFDLVVAADGPDRYLDAQIAATLNVRPDWLKTDDRPLLVKDRFGYVSAGEWGPGFESPSYTASIDAVALLVSQALPGWWWSCGFCQLTNDGSVYVGPHASTAPDFRANASMAVLVEDSKFDSGFHGDRRGGSVPLALLSAILQGLVALSEKQVRVEAENHDAPRQEPSRP